MSSSAIALFGAFENQDIRWNGDSDNSWWVGKDTCDALKIGNHRDALAGLEEDERDYVGIPDAIGRVRSTIIVNEPGIYRLIFKSQGQQAKAFQRWVFYEVLPSIRKTGSYAAQASPFLHPDIRQFHQLLLTADLTATDLRVLIALKQAEAEGTFANLSPPALAEQLALHEATVYRALDRLRKEGIADVRTKRTVVVSVLGQENVLQAWEE